jgi:hypothetical protein
MRESRAWGSWAEDVARRLATVEARFCAWFGAGDGDRIADDAGIGEVMTSIADAERKERAAADRRHRGAVNRPSVRDDFFRAAADLQDSLPEL